MIQNREFEDEIGENHIATNATNPVRKDASESIFVRIDKFHSAKKDIDEIDQDLKQISQVVEKINDIKNISICTCRVCANQKCRLS